MAQAAQQEEQRLRAAMVQTAQDALARMPAARAHDGSCPVVSTSGWTRADAPGAAGAGDALDGDTLPALASRTAVLSTCAALLNALTRVTSLVREVDASLADAQRAGDVATRLDHLSAAVGAFCSGAEAVRDTAPRRRCTHDAVR